MRLMALGTVLVDADDLPASATARVRSHAAASMEDLDRGRRRADFDHLLHQRVGHAVEVAIEGHVVVDVDRCTRPLAHVETLRRQGLKRRFVQAVKQAGP